MKKVTFVGDFPQELKEGIERSYAGILDYYGKYYPSNGVTIKQSKESEYFGRDENGIAIINLNEKEGVPAFIHELGGHDVWRYLEMPKKCVEKVTSFLTIHVLNEAFSDLNAIHFGYGDHLIERNPFKEEYKPSFLGLSVKSTPNLYARAI